MKARRTRSLMPLCTDMQAAQQELLQHAVINVALSTTSAPCLTETFRLLSVAVKGRVSTAWLNILLQGPEDVLQHVVWIADNTLNATLLERYSPFDTFSTELGPNVSQTMILTYKTLDSLHLAHHVGVCVTCRCLDLLLVVAYKCDYARHRVLEANILPVIINAMSAYVHLLQEEAAMQPNAESLSDRISPSTSATLTCVPSHTAVVAALALCEVEVFSMILCT